MILPSGSTLHHPSGRYVLVYNGELYNYRELGRRLERLGYQLLTNSDTEVLTLWLAHFGEAGLADLNGIFAFAFGIRSSRRCCSRAIASGSSPSTSRHRRTLIFASEIKAMLPFLPRCEADSQAISEFVTFQQTVSSERYFAVYRGCNLAVG